MKKFLSLLLTLSCVFAFTIPAFAAENTSDSSFENDVIFAEVSDGSIQEYSASNIIVMTPDQVLELGTEIPSIVETSKMVYINGEIDAALRITLYSFLYESICFNICSKEPSWL